MDLIFLVKFANYLDSKGFYDDAQTVDNFVKFSAQYKPKWGNLALALTPIITTMVLTHLKQSPQLHHLNKTQNSVIQPNIDVKVKEQPTRTNIGEFKEFLNSVEGGISNRNKKFDPGGLTAFGITQKVYNDYRANKNLHHKSVKHITQSERDDIIRQLYWNPVKGDELPGAVALVLADWRFNGGDPIRAVQRIVGIEPTGTLGNKTISAIWKYVGRDRSKENELAQRLISERQKYLESLKTHRHHHQVPLINYNRGWYNRLNQLKDFSEIPTSDFR